MARQLSLSLQEPAETPLPSGRVTHLFISGKTGTTMQPVPTVTGLEGLGFEGCRHGKKRPGGKRQLLLLDAASLTSLGLAAGVLKENAVLEGLALETLPPGQRLQLGAELVVELTEPCVPCWKLEKIREGLLSESWGQRGVLARVIRSGEVSVGADVAVLDINPNAPRPIRPKLP